MGYLAFFLCLTAASLLWSAACTAAAARSERPRLRSLLLFLGDTAPVLALLPFLAATAYLAFELVLRPNWFGPVLTVVLSALIGGHWITSAGMKTIASAKMPVATRWPVAGLFALAILAQAVSFGTLIALDNAVAAEARSMRVEAAAMVAAVLPPAVADDDNAATLHAQAAAAIAAAPELTEAAANLGQDAAEISKPAVGDLLARYAATLDTIRRAADRDQCRFTRDWTRPSIAMPLPEVQALRQEARILAFASRRALFEGRIEDALADTIRLQKIGRHAAVEPIIISQLVGRALDGTALMTLADVLPALEPADSARLDTPAIRDLVGAPQSLARGVTGDEAMGLSTFADFADGRLTIDELMSFSNAFERHLATLMRWGKTPASLLYRVFLLPSDIAGYRQQHRAWRQWTTVKFDRPEGYVERQTLLREAEAEARKTHPQGALARVLVTGFDDILRVQFRTLASNRAGAVLVAATKHRLETGSLSESLDILVPARLPTLPLDPFTTGSSLRMKLTPEELVVWSVGPDGEDDGGPEPSGAARDFRNDDVGLRMRTAAAAAR